MGKCTTLSLKRPEDRPQYKTTVKRNLRYLEADEIANITKELKKYAISTLELFMHWENMKLQTPGVSFSFLDAGHSHMMHCFAKALAWSISAGGWIKKIELGFCLQKRDLQVLADALCLTKSLQELSFSNSGLGNANLQLLAKGLQACTTLKILSLSGCSLTDSIAPVLASILKASVIRQVEADWKLSLRNCSAKQQFLSGILPTNGLKAIDLSWNKLSDCIVPDLCRMLQLGHTLEALDLKGNELSPSSSNMLLDVMTEWGTLKLVDLRYNGSESFGVLEEGKQQPDFSKAWTPFWKNPNPASHSPRMLCASMACHRNASGFQKKPSRGLKRIKAPFQAAQKGKVCKRKAKETKLLSQNTVNTLSTDSSMSVCPSSSISTDRISPRVSNVGNSPRGSQFGISPGGKQTDASQHSTSRDLQLYSLKTKCRKPRKTARESIMSSISEASYVSLPEGRRHVNLRRKKNRKKSLKSNNLQISTNNEDEERRLSDGVICSSISQKKVLLDTTGCNSEEKDEVALLPISFKKADEHATHDQEEKGRRVNIETEDGAMGKSPSCNREMLWDGFTRDITKALLQLNDHLDKLIGFQGKPDDKTNQIVSELRVLCGV